MGTDMAVMLARQLLYEALLLAAPLLLVACIVSTAVSLAQTLTGVQDQTLSTVPRLVVVFLLAVVLLPWSARKTTEYTRGLWTNLHRYLG